MRIAILGSSPSWREAPFDDPDVKVWGINDSYRTESYPRVDGWLECHRFDRMLFRDEPTAPWEIPHGWHLRPTGHLAWLEALRVPLYLQTPMPWPHAELYPLADVLALLSRRYLDSGPAQAVALAILKGATWIGVYGCDLTGDSEYGFQRPNLEWLLGLAQGRGVQIEVASTSALLRSGHLYAFEAPPLLDAVQEADRQLHALLEQRERDLQRLYASPLARLLPQVRRSARLYEQCKEAHAARIAIDNERRFGVKGDTK